MLNTVNTSRRIRAVDFDQSWLRDRAQEMHMDGGFFPYRMHRKVWEFAAIAQVYLDRFGKRDSDSSVSCLGFGCGKEPLPAWVASCGAFVLATDAPDDKANWSETNQRSCGLADLPYQDICSQDEMLHRVSFRSMDMNALPDGLLRGEFDFTWSCGSFEHIGGIEASLSFFCQQIKALRLGGIAAHTTEFNPFDTDATLDESNLCLFRERDLLRLESMLAAQGDRLWPLDLGPGKMEADEITDVPPYTNDVHLSIKVGHWTTTSVLLVAERGGK